MPKAGTYDYPTRDLDDCVSYLTKARQTGGSSTMTREGFAQAIGQSVKGGGFGILVGSMAHYGLIDTGAGQIRITDLGEQIVYGEGDDRKKAMSKAVRNVKLFADIYDRFNREPDESQVKIFLTEKANVPIAEKNELASEIGKLLKKNVPYLMNAPAGGGGEKKDMDNRSSQTNPPLGQYEEYRLGGGVVVSLPKQDTANVWAKAKKALDILLDVKDEGTDQGKEGKSSGR